MPFALRARPRATLLPALTALVLHLGLLWALVLMFRRDGPLGSMAQPSVHLLSQVPSGGGGQGGQLELLRLTAVPPTTPAPVPATIAPPDTAAVAGDQGSTTGDAAGTGGGSGGGSGTGSGPGTGPGMGPADSLPEDRSAPPRPRQEVLPPLDYPRTLRGRSVDVTFWVGVDGRVERVEVSPPLDDARFQRSFLETMRRYRFHPARGPGGSPVPGTRTLTITF